MAGNVISQSADGVWGTAGNWRAETGGTAPPASGDSTFFPAGLSVGISSGHTALSATTLVNIDTNDGFSGNIGAIGSALYIGASGNVRHKGSGQFHFKCGTMTGSRIIIDPSSSSAICSVDTAAVAVPHIAISRGVVSVTGTGTLAHLEVHPRSAALNECNVNVVAGLAVIPNVDIAGGTVLISNTVTDLIVWGGDVTLDSEIFTSLHIFGGLVKLNYAPGVGTPIGTTIYGHGGTVDLMQSTGSKKITTVVFYPGFQMRGLFDEGFHVITNRVYMNGVSPGF